MRRSRWEESEGGSSARINCLRPAPVVVSASGTSRWRSGMDAEKRTVMRRASRKGSLAIFGERKGGDAMFLGKQSHFDSMSSWELPSERSHQYTVPKEWAIS